MLHRKNGSQNQGRLAMFDTIGSRYRAWRKYRDTYGQLMRLSNRELNDIGIARGDIPAIARKHIG